ncbi:MAG TPA: hypothetical protein VMW43_03115 [Bacteroidota bacterium]|nr:hypothetical protein [Bacteroidota bacterium]
MDRSSRNHDPDTQPGLSSRLTYPNPFNPSGIDFDLPGDARVTLQIFDHAGLEIATLRKDHPYPGGTHHVEFNPVGGEPRWVPPGGHEQKVYFYRLSAEIGEARYTDTKKIMFVL